MNIIQKLRKILSDETMDIHDKIIELHSALPKEEPVEYIEIFGQKAAVKRIGTSVVVDGSFSAATEDYIDEPRLANPDDIYYSGCGPTWGEDLDGKRYWKRHNSFSNRHDGALSHGDIVNERARVRHIVAEYLHERGY